MFVRHKEFEKLQHRIERMDGHLRKLTQELNTTTAYAKRHTKAIDRLEAQTGITEPGIVYFRLPGGEPETKPFSLKEKIEAILAHLGLVESIELGNKLVPAPKKKKQDKE